MTKEQAAKILRQGSKMAWDAEEFCEAYDMAIKALEQQPSDDCVDINHVIATISHHHFDKDKDNFDLLIHNLCKEVKDLPPVTPTHGTCKDCKHWKDSDGVYRRGIGVESKCPINNSRVFEGTFYCADFEKRGNEK